MATRACVLITAEPGTTEQVAKGLRQLPGVAAADVVAGTWDLVAVVEQPDVESVGRLVLNQFHGLPGLKNTTTLIAVA